MNNNATGPSLKQVFLLPKLNQVFYFIFFYVDLTKYFCYVNLAEYIWCLVSQFLDSFNDGPGATFITTL